MDERLLGEQLQRARAAGAPGGRFTVGVRRDLIGAPVGALEFCLAEGVEKARGNDEAGEVDAAFASIDAIHSEGLLYEATVLVEACC